MPVVVFLYTYQTVSCLFYYSVIKALNATSTSIIFYTWLLIFEWSSLRCRLVHKYAASSLVPDLHQKK